MNSNTFKIILTVLGLIYCVHVVNTHIVQCLTPASTQHSLCPYDYQIYYHTIILPNDYNQTNVCCDQQQGYLKCTIKETSELIKQNSNLTVLMSVCMTLTLLIFMYFPMIDIYLLFGIFSLIFISLSVYLVPYLC